jgi:hypothetical protein
VNIFLLKNSFSTTTASWFFSLFRSLPRPLFFSLQYFAIDFTWEHCCSFFHSSF